MNTTAEQLKEAIEENDVAERRDRRERMSLTLYEQVDALIQVRDWIDEHEEEIEAAGGELPDELLELLEEVEGDVQAKLERVGLAVLGHTRDAKEVKAERDRLKKAQAYHERVADQLKAYIGIQLYRIGQHRVDMTRCKVRLQKNPAPSVRLLHGDAPVPLRWQRTTIEFNASAALEDLKAHLAEKGEALPSTPGTYEFKELGLVVELGEHVRVW